MFLLFVCLTVELIPFKQQNLLMDILLYLKFKAYLLVSPLEIVLGTFSNPVSSVGTEKLWWFLAVPPSLTGAVRVQSPPVPVYFCSHPLLCQVMLVCLCQTCAEEK